MKIVVEIGKLFKPYIVAEISANHGGSIERAKRTIHAAARCGVDAVKSNHIPLIQ